MDPLVIDYPKWLRKLFVRGIILKTRPKKSASAYSKIWTKEGSPLIAISKKFCNSISQNIDVPIELAMRYGKPSVFEGIRNLVSMGVKEILIIPLYPHFAMSTVESVKIKVKRTIAEYFPFLKYEFLKPFYNHQDYINTLFNHITYNLENKKYDHILFSYHGVPHRHIYKTDTTKSHCKIDDFCCITESKAHTHCYRHQCFETTRLVVKKINLNKKNYSISFQSRLGPDTWLKPYTDKTIISLARGGIKNLAVVAPAFVVDCLETLEEIAIEGEHLFINNGGDRFYFVPCLNIDKGWVNTVSKWCNNWIQ